MLAVRLPGNLKLKLSALTEETHRSKSYYVRQALEDFFSDHEDYLHAVARLEKNNPHLSIEEMERRLGLED